MKKISLFLSFLLLGLCHLSAAEGTVYYKGPKDCELKGIAANGKWACGANTMQNYGFVWDLVNNTFITIDESGGVTGIADDGTAVGTFVLDNVTDNGVSCVAGGYWKNGKAHTFSYQDGTCMANFLPKAISADGSIVVGPDLTNGKYKPCVVKNGVFLKSLPVGVENEGGNILGMSPDGKIIVGWYYYRAPGTSIPNRQSCYWDAEQDYKLIPLYESETERGGWFGAYAVSPNRRYILAYIGWSNPTGDRSNSQTVVFDLQDNRKYYPVHPTLPDVPKPGEYVNAIPNCVMDDGTAIFAMTSSLTDNMYDSFMCKFDGSETKTLDWMKDNYKEMQSPSGIKQMATLYFSADLNTCAANTPAYEDDAMVYYPVVWRNNQENETCPPTSLSYAQLVGLNHLDVKWNAPSFNAAGVTGYRFYFNNEKITDIPADQTYYVFDMLKPNGTISLSALYGDKESEKVKFDYKAVQTGYAEPVTTVGAFQVNQYDAVVKWTSPIVGYAVNLKHHNNMPVKPFGSNTTKVFYAGVDYNKDLVKVYSSKYNITGIEFYFNAPVDDMSIIIYSNDKIIRQQKIDQSKLKRGRMNAVKLDEPVDLPEDGNSSIKLAIRVSQTASGAPLQLAEGPAVKGGDLMSEDEGKTWKTMYELSAGLFNYNWMMSLLLSQNKPDPGIYAPKYEQQKQQYIDSYQILRDGVEIKNFDANELEEGENGFEYKDLNIGEGYHDYEVTARYANGLYSMPKEAHLFVASRPASRCAAPINIKFDLNEDTKNANLTWDMPERTEITYSNWKYLNSLTYQGLTGWCQGAMFLSDQMYPLIGRQITGVKFYPVGAASVAIHVYEGDNEVAAVDLGNKINVMQINNVELKEPVEIKFGYDYFIVLEFYDVAANTMVLGTDNSQPSMQGRYISEDGVNWQIETEIMGGNFMIGMNVDKIEAGVNPGVNYQVYVDDEKYGGIQEKNEYTVSGVVSGKTKVNIAAVYPDGEKMSNAIIIDPTSIDTNVAVEVKVYPNPASSYINISGEVEAIVLVNVSGQEVFHGNAVNTIDVTALPAGMYMLKSTIDGKTYVNKVQVVK